MTATCYLIPVRMEHVFVVTAQHVPVDKFVNQEYALVRNCMNTIVIKINNKKITYKLIIKFAI